MNLNAPDEVVETLVSLVSTWGLQVLGALVVLVVGRWVAGLLRASTSRALEVDLTRRLKEELEAAGCSIPFPQRDVHVFQEKAGA